MMNAFLSVSFADYILRFPLIGFISLIADILATAAETTPRISLVPLSPKRMIVD